MKRSAKSCTGLHTVLPTCEITLYFPSSLNATKSFNAMYLLSRARRRQRRRVWQFLTPFCRLMKNG